MIHKLGKNKKCSFSAATKLKTQLLEKKKRSYQVKNAVFLQFKEKDAAFPQLSYKKRRFYADFKKIRSFSAAFLKIRRKAAEKPAFPQLLRRAAFYFRKGSMFMGRGTKGP